MCWPCVYVDLPTSRSPHSKALVLVFVCVLVIVKKAHVYQLLCDPDLFSSHQSTFFQASLLCFILWVALPVYELPPKRLKKNHSNNKVALPINLIGPRAICIQSCSIFKHLENQITLSILIWQFLVSRKSLTKSLFSTLALFCSF